MAVCIITLLLRFQDERNELHGLLTGRHMNQQVSCHNLFLQQLVDTSLTFNQIFGRKRLQFGRILRGLHRKHSLLLLTTYLHLPRPKLTFLCFSKQNNIHIYSFSSASPRNTFGRRQLEKASRKYFIVYLQLLTKTNVPK